MFGLRTGKVGKLGVVGGARLAPSLLLDFVTGAPTSIADPRITFTRASTATFFDVTGTMQTANANTPRFDFDPVTHAARGLLIEIAVANLLLNSAVVVTQNITVTAQAYTLSFYGTGTIALSGVFTGSLVGSGAFPSRSSLTFTPTAGTLVLTVTGTVQNGQLEAGTYATSYIPTAGTPVTRTADNATISSSGWINNASGAIIVEAQVGLLPETLTTEIIGIGSDSNNLLRLGVPSASSVIASTVFVTTNKLNIVTANSIAGAGVPFRAGITYNTASAVVTSSLSGGAVVSGTASAMLSTYPTMFIGGSGRGGFINGYIRRVRYWPRVLSNAELIAQTT